MTGRRSVTVLGSTGSVGVSTLDLIARNPSAFAVEALVARSNVKLLVQQALAFRPRFVALDDPSGYDDLKSALAGTGIAVGAGQGAVVEAATRPADWTMAAIVGAAGLRSTLAAIRRGGTVALANKESLVCAGSLVMAEVKAHGATLLPVDSEHNAIFQVFDFQHPEAIDKIILTASGGPFRGYSTERMRGVTPAQAVAPPVWSMGAKISIDSATLMNKGLEMIEASHLFPVPEPRIEILVHPQSVIHSMVAYVDGSVLAQLGSPDMRTPIGHALAWPARMATPSPRLDLAKLGNLTFEAPDPVTFPALRLCRQALQIGGGAPTILNAANEIAVDAFLTGKIGFLAIADVVERTMAQLGSLAINDLDAVDAADAEARRVATSFTNGAKA